MGVDGRPQLWTWSIPGMTLRARRPLALAAETHGPITSFAVGAGTGLLVLHGEAAQPPLKWHPAVYHPAAKQQPGPALDAAHVVGVAAAGPHLALRLATAQGQAIHVVAADSPASPPVVRIKVPVPMTSGCAIRVGDHGVRRCGARSRRRVGHSPACRQSDDPRLRRPSLPPVRRHSGCASNCVLRLNQAIAVRVPRVAGRRAAAMLV